MGKKVKIECVMVAKKIIEVDVDDYKDLGNYHQSIPTVQEECILEDPYMFIDDEKVDMKTKITILNESFTAEELMQYWYNDEMEWESFKADSGVDFNNPNEYNSEKHLRYIISYAPCVGMKYCNKCGVFYETNIEHECE